MRKLNIKLDVMDWDIHYLFLAKNENISAVGTKLGMTEDDINEVNQVQERNVHGGGLTLTHGNQRKTIVVIYPLRNKQEEVDIISHETHHVVYRICEHIAIFDVETPALMMGYIMKILRKNKFV